MIVENESCETGDDKGASLTVSGPGGLKGVLRGGNVQVFIYMFMLGAMTWAAIYIHDMKDEARDKQNTVEIAEIRENQKTNTEMLHVMIYVLSLTEAERAKLAITKPKSLREMER